MIRTWTPDQEQFLRDNYKQLSYTEIAAVLGKPADQVKGKASRMKITVSRKWPDEDLRILREQYPHRRTEDIAKDLGRHTVAVYAMAHNLGIEKSKEFKNGPLSGRISKGNHDGRGAHARFQKGMTTWNKGTKGVSGQHPNCRRTQFKNGAFAHNRRELGEERINDQGYAYVKVQDGKKNANWRLKHWVIWEKANGREVPADHLLHFKDRDKLNFDLDNLELISRVDWIDRNRAENLYPEPVVKAIRQLAGFKRKLNRYAKEQDRRSA